LSLDYATKNHIKDKKVFNNNPLFGGPKYGNLDLKNYEEQRERNSQNSRSNSLLQTHDPIPINRYNNKTQQKTRRYFMNRYANLSNFSMDWQGKKEMGYRHPLGVNHTALDCNLREKTRNKNTLSSKSPKGLSLDNQFLNKNLNNEVNFHTQSHSNANKSMGKDQQSQYRKR